MANPFLLTEVGKVDWVLCFAFGALRANVTNCIRINFHNWKVTTRTTNFSESQAGYFIGGFIQFFLFLGNWKRGPAVW